MDKIFDIIDNIKNEPLSKHTTMRVGGMAKYVFMPKNADEIKMLVDYCVDNSIRYIVVGNGSNLIFMDEGFDGFVILLSGNMNNILIDNTKIEVMAGANLSKIANLAKDNSLTGMEFAAGIPGTLGGAIVMNAGAYGGEMKDIVESVDVLEKDGTIKTYANSDMDFSYRHSIIDDSKIVISAVLKLEKGDKTSIVSTMEDLKNRRISKQPLEYPSSGSTFKRPDGYFAGKLIEDAGLKGYRVGGACVSTKHCGFVVNDNNASTKDVLNVIDDVRRIVFEKFNVMLEPEVKIIK